MASNRLPSPWAELPAIGPLLRPSAAAGYIGVSTSTLYEMARHGDLPHPLKIGARASGIPKSWLDAAIAAKAPQGGQL